MMDQRLSRRRFVATAGAAVTAAAAAAASEPVRVGVASASYGFRLSRERELAEPLRFLRFCRERGAGGVQTSIPAGDAVEIRRFLDESGLWLEGSVRLPRDRTDVDRFEADVRAAKSAGRAC